MTTIEPRQLRDACGNFGTGVTIIATRCDDHDHGMTANAFMSISLEPPLIAISIAAKARMLACIRKSGRFAVSVLAEGMEDLAWHSGGAVERSRAMGRKPGGPEQFRDGLLRQRFRKNTWHARPEEGNALSQGSGGRTIQQGRIML